MAINYDIATRAIPDVGARPGTTSGFAGFVQGLTSGYDAGSVIRARNENDKWKKDAEDIASEMSQIGTEETGVGKQYKDPSYDQIAANIKSQAIDIKAPTSLDMEKVSKGEALPVSIEASKVETPAATRRLKSASKDLMARLEALAARAPDPAVGQALADRLTGHLREGVAENALTAATFADPKSQYYNPQKAAEYATKAYAYVPDGKSENIIVKDGKMYFGEGGPPVDHRFLLDIATQATDPKAFAQAVWKLNNPTAQEAAYIDSVNEAARHNKATEALTERGQDAQVGLGKAEMANRLAVARLNAMTEIAKANGSKDPIGDAKKIDDLATAAIERANKDGTDIYSTGGLGSKEKEIADNNRATWQHLTSSLISQGTKPDDAASIAKMAMAYLGTKGENPYELRYEQIDGKNILSFGHPARAAIPARHHGKDVPAVEASKIPYRTIQITDPTMHQLLMAMRDNRDYLGKKDLGWLDATLEGISSSYAVQNFNPTGMLDIPLPPSALPPQ